MKNALKSQEHENIKKTFNNFKRDIEIGELKKYEDNKITVSKDGNLASSFTLYDELDNQTNLRQINDQISEKIYGKITKPILRYEYKKLNSLPEPLIYGENVWHADRYIPNLKFLYFPNEINENEAPHKYALGSHKINKDYLNFFLNKTGPNISRRTIDTKEDEDKFLNKAKEFPVSPNTLIVVLTNGFHARAPFKQVGERCTLVLQNDNFKLQSLISYSNSI